MSQNDEAKEIADKIRQTFPPDCDGESARAFYAECLNAYERNLRRYGEINAELRTISDPRKRELFTDLRECIADELVKYRAVIQTLRPDTRFRNFGNFDDDENI